MWTMTTRGFFSAVQHRDDADLLVVRTRDHSDAEHLNDWYQDWLNELAAIDTLEAVAMMAVASPEVVQYPHADYPWRVILPRTAYGAFMAEAVEDLDYGNFKDAVKTTQGPDRAQVYGSVWAALLRLETLDPMGRDAETPWAPEDDLEDPWTV